MRVQELSIQEPAWLERRGPWRGVRNAGVAGMRRVASGAAKMPKGQTPRASLPATRSLMIFFSTEE